MSDFDFRDSKQGSERKLPVLKASKKAKDEDDDIPIRSKKRGLNVPLWVLLVAILATGLLAGGAGIAVGYVVAGKAGGRSTSQAMDRVDLETWAQQKTWDDFKAKFGKPTLTRSVRGPSGFQVGLGAYHITYMEYHYERISIDTKGSGKVDAKVIVSFHEGGLGGNAGDFAKLEFVN